MRSSYLFIYVVLLLALSSSHAGAQALTFVVDTSLSKVQFVSDATLEKITGVGAGLSGEVKLDPTRLAHAKAQIQLDIATLHTGLELRDEHLRGANWLDAKQFPTAVLQIDEVAGIDAIKPGHTSELTIKGRLTLHGVTRPIEAKAKLRWTPASTQDKQHTLHVQATFVVALESHNVSIPSVVTLKVARDIQINVDLYAHAK